ncbi:MAG TPA: hypothetical protein V6D10_00195 [Trichocoleus sp.]|jgi:tRNA threonylcarbamoyladenosine modification (KEOPS) complex  Pcc1 subunit
MADLSTEQLLYLLYARAYLEDDGTVLKSAVKSCLSKVDREKSEKIYEALQRESLIQPARRGRISLTKQGEEALLVNLGKTDYEFTSNKGAKVLNMLMLLIKQALGESFHDEITFAEFREKFKEFYFDERKTQSLKGVALVKKRELAGRFIDQHLLSRKGFNEFFDELKRQGNISITEGRDDQLIEWVE